LIIAVLGHTAINAFAVIFASKMDIVLLEGLIFLFGTGWLVWAWLIRPRDLDRLDPVLPPPPKVLFQESQITSNQIEESRYE
jgi:hypothetical protein